MIAIYKLTFKELEDWPYIGQTRDLEVRLRAHIQALKRGTANYKMLEAYNISGDFPILEVLEEVTEENINEREKYYIEKFDSINNGLNITTGGDSSGSGYNHARSKFTREQLFKVFELLTSPLNSLWDIEQKTGVSKSQVWCISAGRTHIWLQKEFPESWEQIQGINRAMQSRKVDLVETIINFRTGEEVTASSATEFAKITGEIGAGFHSLLNRDTTHYKDWFIKGEEPKLELTLVKEGKLYRVYSKYRGEFCNTHNVNKNALSLMVKGKQKTTNGFSIATKDQINSLLYGDEKNWFDNTSGEMI